MHRKLPLSAAILALLLAACGHEAEVPVEQTIGPDPVLPEPSPSWIPTVNIAEAVGWPAGIKPVAGEGLQVQAFATGLDHPRWLYTLPNGDVLVAETNAPPRPDDNGGIRGWFAGLFQDKAGAKAPSANRITLLRDADGDGIAEMSTPFLEQLNSPFGMSLVGDQLFVAATDAVLRFPYKEGASRIAETGQQLASLPAGPINHHWTKSLVASPDGARLYAGIGSNSNAAENGLPAEEGRAAIQEIDIATGQSRLYATGLRNPVGLAFAPDAPVLWAVVNERDELGSDLVPDYLTSVTPDAFYGWPFSYWGQHVDDRVEPQQPDLVAKAIKPDYALGNHVAPLGLTFATGDLLPPQYRSGAFVGRHGSWNREPRNGYDVIFVPFEAGRPAGPPIQVLTGFVTDEDEAYGRPAGVTIAKDGALLVADDVGNVIWRVSPSK